MTVIVPGTWCLIYCLDESLCLVLSSSQAYIKIILRSTEFLLQLQGRNIRCNILYLHLICIDIFRECHVAPCCIYLNVFNLSINLFEIGGVVVSSVAWQLVPEQFFIFHLPFIFVILFCWFELSGVIFCPCPCCHNVFCRFTCGCFWFLRCTFCSCTDGLCMSWFITFLNMGLLGVSVIYYILSQYTCPLYLQSHSAGL